jgi:hypothetical protein
MAIPTFNSFQELAASQSVGCANVLSTYNSQIAELIQDYDRVVKNLESTQQLVDSATQTTPPEVQAELVKPKTKYEVELLKAKQKILDTIQTTSPDDFDRSILAASTERTKADLTGLLAGAQSQQPVAQPAPAPLAPVPVPNQPAPPLPTVDSDVM